MEYEPIYLAEKSGEEKGYAAFIGLGRAVVRGSVVVFDRGRMPV
jgi:hypothetical protein